MTQRYCTICRAEIADDKRLRRSSPYCSDDCRRTAKVEKRERTAGEKCRLCGRRFRAKASAVPDASATVAHTFVTEEQ
jgi:hypothetical protein